MKSAFLALAGFLALTATSLPAQETTALQTSTPDVKTALDQVVTRQLTAFGAGDFSLAYTFAAAGIQKMFPPAVFEKMVRASYPIMLGTPKVDFGVALDDGQEGVLFVELTGPDGPQVFRYTFTLETSGWRITGVEQVEDTAPRRRPLSA